MSIYMTIPSLLRLLFSFEKQKYSEFEMLHTVNVGASLAALRMNLCCTQRRRGTEGYYVLAIYRCAENRRGDPCVHAEAPRHGGVLRVGNLPVFKNRRGDSYVRAEAPRHGGV